MFENVLHSEESISFSSTKEAAKCSIHNSRRQLFPSIEEDNLDDFSLTPLSSNTSSPFSPQSTTSADLCSLKQREDENVLLFSGDTIEDYVIIENIHDTSKNSDIGHDFDEIKTPLNDKLPNQNTIIMITSPLHLSPPQIVPQSVVFSPKKLKSKSPDIGETQDTSALNTIATKLIRNYSEGNSPSPTLEIGKRKIGPSNSGLSNKLPKLEQTSKVRVELFPKSIQEDGKQNNENESPNTTRLKGKSSIYLCGGRTTKKKFGQINAGVRHKIKKPKMRKLRTKQLLHATLDIVDSNVFNNAAFKNYLQCVEDFNAEFGKTQIQPLPHTTSSNAENKSESSSQSKIVLTKKRPAECPLHDENKKFFKSQRTSAILVDEHFNFKLDKEKTDNGESGYFKEFDISLDASDLLTPEESLISSETLDSILGSLRDEVVVVKSNCEPLILTAYNSVTMSENSIHLHVPAENDDENDKAPVKKCIVEKSILLSPTSQMCSMTSGLALNSPTRNQETINYTDTESQKLYPVFCRKQNNITSNCFKVPKNPLTKKIKPLPKNQLLLDAGQKRFGATECTVCQFVYHMGDPNDELLHQNYHNSGNVLRYNGWKDERVVSQIANDRIIKVIPSDPKSWLKKIKDLLEVVNRDLGYYEMPVSLDNVQAFLYIHKQVIVGCVIAEYKTVAYHLLSDNIGIDLCSEASYPIKCGISRIWVSQVHRKKGIATSLLNCLRANFIYGYIMGKEDLAFSSPTDAGKAFAAKYFNTPNFLVYT